MHKHFGVTRTRPVAAGHFFAAARRSLQVVVTLVLAAGGLGHLPGAQAAPAGANVRYYMDVVNPKTTVCTGETVTYVVNVHSQFTSAPPGWTDKNLPAATTLAGVTVEALSTDKAVGNFKTTGKQVTGMEFDGTNSVEFEFVAGKKPGSTTLYFEGAVPGYDINMDYVSFPVPVKVIVCEYKVNVISNWFVTEGTDGSIALVALIQGATLSADTDGHYTGSTSVLWIPHIVLPSACSHTDTVSPSPANLVGDLNESGELVVQVTYDTATLAEQGACPPQDIDTKNPLSPEALTIRVPSAGGTKQGNQKLKDQGIPGSFVITVIPVEN